MKRQQFTIILAIWTVFLCAGFLSVIPTDALAQYTAIYRNYRELGFEALEQRNYKKALLYFETAQSAYPNDVELVEYINLVKRLIEKRVEGPQEVKTKKIPPVQKKKKTTIARPQPQTQQPIKILKKLPEPAAKPPQPQNIQNKINIQVLNEQSAESAKTKPLLVPDNDQFRDPIMADEEEYPVELLELNDERWSEQPNAQLDLPLDTKLIIRSMGDRISRFLLTAPEVVDSAQTSRTEITISPIMRSQTFLHIWEDSGRRWTFVLNCTVPLQVIKQTEFLAPRKQVSADTFKFTYDTNWYSMYSGPSKDALDRTSMNFINTFGLYGPTPYGNMDAALTTHKTDIDPTEATYYTLGLSQGNIGVMDDFHMRLFDSTTTFSSLTLPGRQIRGFLLQDKVYYDEFSYTVLRGQARSTYGTASPNISTQDDSYVEGVRVKYKPSDDFGVGVNYAHAWGDDKSNFAKDRVMSIEVEKKITDNIDAYTEFAHDENESAQKARLNYAGDLSNLEVRLRNVPTDYATVTGAPSGQGEIGTEFIYNRDFEHFDFFSYLDLYRDHENKNPENPDAINIDFNSNIYVPFENKSSWRTDFYYFHSPGLLSDDTDTRLSSTYSKLFNVWSKDLSTFVTGTTQARRSDSNLDSEYDRHSLTTGFYYSLTNDLSISSTYDQYWVKDRGDAGNTVYPSVLYTSLDYHKMINERWRWNMGLSYRDEQRTENRKSFLAGQDNAIANVGLTYSPSPDVNIYLDGRLRDVWAENDRNTSFTEADINFGMRSMWDLGFAWNPSALVEGHVFKDVNSNGRRDEGEPGIGGVRVLIGEASSVTDSEGWYYTEIKAQSVVIRLDFDTIPDGYVFQEKVQQEFEITHKDVIVYDIALATHSGVYGLVFVDANGNNIPDPDEEKIGNVRITLDKKMVAASDPRGAYFFNNIEKGKHSLTIDIGSIPLPYLPSIALEHEITVTEGSTYILHIPVHLKK